MENSAKIRIVVGLGNEGEEYERTYHNVGSYVSDHLRNNEVLPRPRFFKLTGFMNNIGVPVRNFAAKNKALPIEMLIIHDETDLSVGEYKLSFGGGSAGHKGVQSIIDNLGTPDFWRLRIGVRDPREQVRRKAEEFVLHGWSAAEESTFTAVGERARKELLIKKLI